MAHALFFVTVSSITHTHTDTQTTTQDQLPPGTPMDQRKFGGVHWNEWEMRRDALKMAALTNCRTRATQTDRSAFRREATTQYSLPVFVVVAVVNLLRRVSRLCFPSTACRRTARCLELPRRPWSPRQRRPDDPFVSLLEFKASSSTRMHTLSNFICQIKWCGYLTLPSRLAPSDFSNHYPLG